MTDYPSKQLEQFVVRLPDGMRDRVKDAAARNNRSMNAEIVATLEEKYPDMPFDAAQFVEVLARAATAQTDEERAKGSEAMAYYLQDFAGLPFSVHVDEGEVRLQWTRDTSND